MKRRFTILSAALALLVSLAIPMGMWGQTRADQTVNWTATSGGLGSGIGSGTISTGSYSWSYTRTLISGSSYTGWTNNCIQLGKNGGVENLTLTTSAIPGTIKSVSVECSSYQGKHNVSITVGGTTYLASTATASWTTVNAKTGTGTSSGTITISFTGGTRALYIKSITVIYDETGGGTPTTPSNLALTGAPISLTFDLYNNSSAQTISYTTSSTGTVSVQENDYVTANVDQQNKTITVTPKAITNGNQTITVNQAADATYLAGSKTFTVNITDSTPGVVFIAGTDLGSTTGNNSPDQMTKENVTISSTDAAFATEQYRLYQSSVTTITVPAGYYITSIVFTGAETDKPISNLSVNDNNGVYVVENNIGTWTGSSSSVAFSASAQARASRIRVVVEQDNTPTIAVSLASLNAFSYLSTSATPSAAQTVSVSGANLSANITVALGNNSDFEISLAENSDYTNSLTLAQTNGTVGATTIYVRMKSGLSAGSHNDNLALSSTGATSINIELSGSVIAPKTVAQAIAAIDEASNNEVEGAYVAGIVCQVDSYNSQYHSITYWISDDGETTTKLQVFGGKGLDGANFNSKNDLIVGDEVVVFGDLMIYGDTYEFNSNNYLVSFNRPEPEPFTLTVSNLSNVEMHVFNAADQNTPLINGEGTAQINNGTSVLLRVTAEAGYIMESLVVDDVDVTSSIVDDAYTFTMPRRAVTVTATAVIAPLYTVTLCDDQTALTEASYGAGVTLPSRTDASGTYTFAGWSTTNVGGTETTTAPTIIPVGEYHPTQNIILYPVYTRTETGGGTATEWHLLNSLSETDAGVYALVTSGGDNNDAFYAFNGTITSGHGQCTPQYFIFDSNGIATSAPTGTLEITFIPVEENGSVVGFKMYNEDNKYLYAKKNASGNLDWHQNENSYWSVHESGNWYYPTTNGDAYLRSYSNSSFRTYGNNSGSLLRLAKKVEVAGNTTYYTSLLSTYPLTITAYSTGGYRLIASPLEGNVNPKYVTNMITDPVNGSNTYDLYAFDPTQTLEWRNYRSNDGGGFNLETGKGYLYGNSSEGGVELVFTGTPYNGNGQVTLTKAEAAAGLDFPEWNLVGNPFATDIVEIYDVNNNKLSFYTMSANGKKIIPATNTTVQPMEGVFVVADYDEEKITFTPVVPEGGGKDSQAVLDLSEGNELIDRAIVRFGQGRQLPKLQLDRNSSKLYIPQDGQDYAVVCSEEMGAMPVNFKAENNGTYSLNFSTENVGFAYLHLIDNMTGRDIDLLQTPSYTFNAKTTDYANRFKLVFATGDNSNDNNFAFFSNGSFVINNDGAATLQVIDITGRIVKSESITGCANVNVNAAPGVYMLRLVNGDNVKVQKVVVK